MIGIVGGVGPAAGLLLHKKVSFAGSVAAQIIDNTLAHADGDHIDVVHVSMASQISDRTDYLLHRDCENPAVGASHAVLSVLGEGSTVRPVILGVPCNTFHSASIFRSFELLLSPLSHLHVVHMVSETMAFLRRRYPEGSRIGYLSSTGTRLSCVYDEALTESGFLPETVPDSLQSMVHDSIYNESWGIKALSHSSSESIQRLSQAAEYLRSKRVECLLLACTELPIVMSNSLFKGSLTLIDPMDILARSLIRRVDESLLRDAEPL